MREHVEDGALQAWLDDELRGREASRLERHLEQCAACRDRAEALRGLEARVVQGLLPLEGEVDLAAARREVVRRRSSRAAGAGTSPVPLRGAGLSAPPSGPRTVHPPGEPSGSPTVPGGQAGPSRGGDPRFGKGGSAGGRGGWGRRRSVAAAAILVLVAGGAAALPGSPVRQWLDTARGGVDVPEIHGMSAAGEVMSGVAVGLRDGRVEVVLRSPPPGSRVEVRVEREERVELQAPLGARYATAPGRLEVDLSDAEGGPLLLLIPGAAREVLLVLERRPLMTWMGGTFRLEEGVRAETRGEGLVVALPEPEPAPPSSP